MSPPQRSPAGRTRRYLFRTILGLSLLGALGLALAIGYLDRLREPLIAGLSAALGMEVGLERLGLGLAGWSPRLTLEGLVLGGSDDAAPPLRLPRLHLELDPRASLAARGPRIRTAVLESPRLRLERREDGQLVLAGLPLGRQWGTHPNLGAILERGRLRVLDGEVEWLDRQTGAPPLLLTAVRLDLDSRGERRHLALEAKLAKGSGESAVAGAAGRGAATGGEGFWLTADLDGGSGGPSDWSGPVTFGLITQDLGWLSASRLLPGFQVSGTGLDLRGTLEVQDARPREIRARLKVEELSLLGRVPSQGPLDLRVERLDLGVTADAGAGRLDVIGEDLTLMFPGVFGDRPAIRAERLAGPLDWAIAPAAGLSLNSGDLTAHNPDLGLRLDFTLQVPWKAGKPAGGATPADFAFPEASLRLDGEIQNASAVHIRDYLPVPKLKPRARAWLDRAFPAGRVPLGVVLFQGRLADFPFREEQGHFHVLLRVEDMALDFDPAWPRLEGLEGIVHFHNQRLAIATSGGRIRGFPLIAAQAVIPDLAAPRFLGIQGSAQGPFDQALAFLGATPLSDHLGALPNLFRAEGVARVDLDMDLPLDRQDHPQDRLRLAGALSWPDAPGPTLASPGASMVGKPSAEGASLSLAGMDLTLDDLQGALSFSASGVTPSRVWARFLGKPLTLDLERAREPGSPGGLTALRLAGTSGVKDLAARLPAGLWRYLEGETPWELEIRLPDPPPRAEARTLTADFLLQSSLRGLAVKLPSPVGKARDEARPLRLEWRLEPGQDLPLMGRYGDLALNLRLDRDDVRGWRLGRGALAWGQTEVALPPPGLLRISGRLPHLDAMTWRDWAAKLPGEAATTPPRLSLDEVRIDRLQLGPLGLRETTLDLEQGTKAWELRVESRELAGHFSIPHQTRTQPLQADIARLDLLPLIEAETGPAADQPGPRSVPKSGKGADPLGTDPRRAPSLEVTVNRLLWGETDLGRFSLSAEADEPGLAITGFRLAKPGRIDLQGSGAWRTGEGMELGESLTTLDLAATSGDLGDLLQHLGFASPLADAPATATANLSWPGSPGDFSPATLAGEVSLEIGKGSLLEVDPGVGRVLGVLNLGALGRRLALDFTDLYDRGFVFQSIKGKLDLAGGRVELVEPLVIEGTSAEVRIEGRANLLDKSLDQVATVTPSLGGGVALASAIAAGPLVGAAVFIADKASGGALDALGRHAYDIRGPWANPEIVPRDRLAGGATGENSAGADLSASSRDAVDEGGDEAGGVPSSPAPPGPPSAGNAFLDQP